MAKKSKIKVFRQSRACYGIDERAILNPVTRWQCKYLQYPKQVFVSYKRLYCLQMVVQQIERLLLQLFPVATVTIMEHIIERKYTPWPSICFVVDKPVKREIFAADFRDRVIHHFIFNYISPIFEKTFINDSYSCRIGKGTHYGIKRIDHFIRSCSNNYSKDCYILKLDIKGYFMAMNKSLLFDKVKKIF